MARPVFAVCIAALLGLHAPLPAIAQDAPDEEVSDDPGDPGPEEEEAASGDAAADEPAPDDPPEEDLQSDDLPADDLEADGATAEEVSDEPDDEEDRAADAANLDLLANDDFEADAEDILVADDQFNEDELEDFSDDAVAVETGNDGIPDVFELYDDDGEPAFDEGVDADEQRDAINPGDDADMFFERLPTLRRPGGASAPPVTYGLPPVSSAKALAFGPKAGTYGTAAPLLARIRPVWSAAGAARPAGLFERPAPVAASSAPLRLVSGISGAFNLSRGASSVYLVRDGGAPYQAQVNYATSPRTWEPAAKYAAYAKYPDWEARHICGGTLIAPNWVLTAAHCLWSDTKARAETRLARGINVLLGAENIARPKTGMTYKVDRIVIHSGFRPNNIYRHDIALLRIVSGSSTSRLNQISSIGRHAGAEPRDRTDVSVTGWGKTIEMQSQLASTALWRADVNLIAGTRCRAMPGFGKVSAQGIERIGPGSLCAGESRGKACSGDSGGPLVFTNVGPAQLVGITSWTKDQSCGQPDIPNVYTRVGAYAQWIEDAMRAAGGAGVSYFP